MDISLKELLSFMGIVLLLVMFPGPNTVLVMQSVGVSGKKSGFYNVAGIVSALYFHAILAAIGLSVIVTQSTQLYLLIKYMGAIYILYLGFTSLYFSYLLGSKPDISTLQSIEITNKEATENLVSSYSKGLITNIFNPKVALFYLSFIPQFIHNQNELLLESLFLAFLHSLISVLWYSSLVLCVDKFKSFLGSNTIKRRIKALSGVVLVGLGFKMAVKNN